MSLANFKKRFKKESKSQIFVLGSAGTGKSTLLKVLEKKLCMKNSGTEKMAGVKFDAIKSKTVEIHSYHYDKSTWSTMTKFIQQETTKCVIFVIDSRKEHIIKDAQGNDVRSNIKEIGKIIPPNCHILILCNKQDITNESILPSDEIGKILDIDRVFSNNKHSVLSCSFTENTNTSSIVSYLTENNLVLINENDENKTDDNDDDHAKSGKITKLHHKNSKSFVNIFKKRTSSNAKKGKEVIMILGLDKVGKSKILDSFGFGKRSKTSIAIFEAETIKCENCQFHAWNYEQRSWPMCKSFFNQTTLVIYVIDSTQFDKLKSDKKNEWTVESYLKTMLGVTHEQHVNDNNKMPSIPSSAIGAKPFIKSKSYNNKDDVKEEEWPLKCPFLVYLNKTDLDSSTITKNDLEQEIQLSRLMKSKGIKHFVQESSAKTKKGIYDGLIWCHMNGLLKSIKQIKEYATKNDIKLL